MIGARPFQFQRKSNSAAGKGSACLGVAWHGTPGACSGATGKEETILEKWGPHVGTETQGGDGARAEQTPNELYQFALSGTITYNHLWQTYTSILSIRMF